MPFIILMVLETASLVSKNLVRQLKTQCLKSDCPFNILTQREALLIKSNIGGTLLDIIAQYLREIELKNKNNSTTNFIVLIGFHDPYQIEPLITENEIFVFAIVLVSETESNFENHLIKWKSKIPLFHYFWPDGGITAIIDDFDILFRSYQAHIKSLISLPSTKDFQSDSTKTYSSILDEFSENAITIEVILDAILEDLCGSLNNRNYLFSTERWMPTIVEDGDLISEMAIQDSRFLSCVERTTRIALSYVSSFWPALPSKTDSRLLACLVQQLYDSLTESNILSSLSLEQFSMCINIKFLATIDWHRLSKLEPSSQIKINEIFPKEYQGIIKKFLALDYLLYIFDENDDTAEHPVFQNTHIEYLESYTLAQRIVKYSLEYINFDVKYSALTDTLIFCFFDEKPDKFVEYTYDFQLTGSKSFQEYAYKVLNAIKNTEQFNNIIKRFYCNSNYSNIIGTTKYYITANGEYKTSMEVYRLYGNCFDHYEQRHIFKIVCPKYWVSTHRLNNPISIEINMGFNNGTLLSAKWNKYQFDMVICLEDGLIIEYDQENRSLIQKRHDHITLYFSDGNILGDLGGNLHVKFEVRGLSIVLDQINGITAVWNDCGLFSLRSNDNEVILNLDNPVMLKNEDNSIEWFIYGKPSQLGIVFEMNIENEKNICVFNDGTSTFNYEKEDVNKIFKRTNNSMKYLPTKYVFCRRNLSGYELFNDTEVRKLITEYDQSQNLINDRFFCLQRFIAKTNILCVKTLTRGFFSSLIATAINCAIKVYLEKLKKFGSEMKK